MTGKVVSPKIRWTVYAISFILAVVATFFMLPQGGEFDKNYEEGRPWNYEMLTAPMNFAIYKSDKELKAEKDSALKRLEPYLTIDREVETRQMVELRDNSRLARDRQTAEFVEERLKEIYAVGVLSLKEGQDLQKTGIKRVVLLDKRMVGHKVAANLFFTPKTAYEYILAKADMVDWVDIDLVKSSNIGKFIEPNVRVDVTKTEQVKEELISQVMPTYGMVQKGEKIVDKGEIITHETYKIINSLDRILNNKGEEEKTGKPWKIAGSIVLTIGLYLMLFVYFKLFREKVLETIRATEFMLLMVLSMLFLLWLVTDYLGTSEYIVPLAMLPLVIRVFFDSRTAFFVHIVTVLLASQMVADKMLFIMLQIVAGMVAVSSLKNMNSRSQLLKSALLIFASYVLTYIAVELSIGVEIKNLEWKVFLAFAINAIALLFVYGLIFIIEKLFGFLSEVTLVELSNVNSPLLMEFSEKCPGTFQHVLQVSNLSVEVAKKINANALLVRTGALYHDIGKMDNPMYYTENQTGMNPLNNLPFEEAAQIIISHVASGVKIANKNGLPYQIIEFIRMHHGTSKAKYFYNSFKNAYPDKEIDEAKFTYPGPLPSTKETAILMMADSVEAASRSLGTYDDESIDKLVENVVNAQIADGQFKNSPISFKDVEVAKSVLKDKLKSIYHSRIKYPELKEPKKEETGISSLLNFTSKLNGVRKPYRFQKK